jgi:upstream activation factor subunit UAF30
MISFPLGDEAKNHRAITRPDRGGDKMAKKKATKKAAKKTTKKAVAKKATKKAATKKAAPKKAAKATAKKAAPKKKRTLNPALKAPYTPSAQLAEIVGASPLPRQEVVSKLWKYIKKNGLQDRQTINADEKLKPIFGNKKSVTMFEMQKHVSKHLTKTA